VQLQRIDDATFQLDLHPEEAALIATLCEGLRVRLLTGADDADLVRLSPPANADDDELARQYREVVGDGLVSSRLEALDTMVRTAADGRLSRDELERWLTGLNALRLVLGTALGVDDDHDPAWADLDDSAFAEHQLYDDLGAVMGLFLHVLTAP
jgi:hypothetical protein